MQAHKAIFAHGSSKGCAALRMVLPVVLAIAMLAASAAGAATPTDIIDLANGEEDLLLYGGYSGDWLGMSQGMCRADVNGDGVDDLIVAAQRADGPLQGRNLCGEVYIFYGGTSLSGIRDVAGLAGAVPDVTIYGAESIDYLGQYGIHAGDFNKDGKMDIVLLAVGADGPGNARPNAGDAYIIFGSASLPSVIDLAVGGQSVLIYGATDGDRLGSEDAVAVGDLNGDGYDDLVLGSRDADGYANLYSGAGEAYIILGSASMPPIIDLATSGEDVTIYGGRARTTCASGEPWPSETSTETEKRT